ncbi:hypothetical protein Tco_0960349 [Tanacetum coccineum]
MLCRLPEVFLEAVSLSSGRGVTVYISPPPFLASAGLGNVVVVVVVVNPKKKLEKEDITPTKNELFHILVARRIPPDENIDSRFNIGIGKKTKKANTIHNEEDSIYEWSRSRGKPPDKHIDLRGIKIYPSRRAWSKSGNDNLVNPITSILKQVKEVP